MSADAPHVRGRELVARIDPRHGTTRVAIAIACGLSSGLLATLRYSAPVAALFGWVLGGFVLLALAWTTIATADAARTQARAAPEDPGRTAVYALVLITSAASLFAATALVRGGHHVAAPGESGALVALCLGAVAISWTMTHTAFTLRYAHLYYREDDEGVGGVEFPGGAAPTYADFAYLAFTVGMCFQVSDACVSSAQIRRSVLLQALISFAYNTAILAFVLNLAFSRAA